MYKYEHRTRGHPKLQRLLAFIFTLIMLVTMVPADLTKADAIEHTHIWADKYDSNNHWKYCTVCSEKRNVTAHTFTETKTWTSTGSCDHYIHYYSCKCGYHYTYTKPHQVEAEWHGTGNRLSDYKACSNCGTWIYQNDCQDSSGKRIGCNNPGICVRCGYTATIDTHYLSQGVCKFCKKIFFKETSGPTVTYSSDYKTCTITFTITPMNSSCSLTGAESYGWTDTPNWSSISMNSVLNSDGSRTFTQKITFNTAIKSKANVGYSGNGLERINGINVFESDYPPVLIWYDHQAPVQNDVIQKDQASANGWATIKQLTLSGTENNSDIVYLTVSDKATGEKYVTDAAVSVVNGKYSYICTPSIEGDANGRTYVVTAKDSMDNTSTKEFIVSKTDGSCPQLKNGTSLTYTDWTTSKNISLNFFDFGAGGVEASLDNQTDYKPLTKSGEYYVWNHSFGNQVGTSEHTIYVRDALGNAGSYKLTVGNTDSNVYSITYNLNGGAMSGQKTGYTVTDSFTLPTPTRTGYTFTGWTGSNGTTPQKTVTINKGTRGNLSYTANWQVNIYTNHIYHWLWGLKNGEGTNDNKGAFQLGTTTFQPQYESAFVLDSAKAINIPNGCCLRMRFGSFDIEGTWNQYSMGTKVTQKAGNMNFEYDYDPVSYSITYNLNGGTNNNANPSTYNVLYGVTLKSPTRAGYTFTGWYDESGNKITGINEGCNATFSSADDLYTKLAKRTTGNRVLTAHWSYNPVSVKVPQVLTGDHTGKSQFRIKCDDFKAGNIKISVPNSFLYKQTGKADITATITAKSGNNTITPTNKVCTYDITTKNGLTAGCWQGSFNIGLTLTKE